jgi:class 3 adenylate cyclase
MSYSRLYPQTKRNNQTGKALNSVNILNNIMRYPEFHYQWEWHLEASPENLWPLMADTNRFNRDTGVPAIEQRGVTAPNARRRLRLFRLGVPVEWEEEPFEWTRPHRYSVKRRYSSGPVADMRTLAELNPTPQGGTHLVYQVWARPANPLGLIAIPAQIGFLSARSFDATIRRYNRFISTEQSNINMPSTPTFVPGGRARLATIHENLLAAGTSPDIVALVIDTIETADAMELAHLRPYELADRWHMDRRAVLEHFLLATRYGLFELQWDVLCPLCRGAKVSGPTLGVIEKQVHCETCNIDFGVNFDQSVELSFRVNPAIRDAEKAEFCIAGPQTTPHVAAQQLVAAGEERLIAPELESGRYRLRTLTMRGGEFLQVTEGGIKEVTLRASTIDGWPSGELQIASEPLIRLKNSTETEQLFILERLAWSDQAAKAAEVTALQLFRDLFSNEALRPGEQISVGSLTIIFTDLRGSTNLYNDIGDAPAFGLVMTHFDVLREMIKTEGGAIVKTIGDAVMAVFPRPAPAVRAILMAQQALAQMDDGGGHPLRLKAGIHYGPCIAVTLNERLDYFGSTINMAARLEGFSSGNDVIISGAVRSDPEVAELLGDPTTGLRTQQFAAQLKGFNADSFDLWRVAYAAETHETAIQT